MRSTDNIKDFFSKIRIPALAVFVGTMAGFIFALAHELARHGLTKSFPYLFFIISGILAGIAWAVILYKEKSAIATRLQAEAIPFRELVENIHDIIFALDAAGRITYISPVIKTHTGYAPEQLINQPVTILVHHDDSEGFLESFEKTMNGIDDPLTFRLISKDSSSIWVRSLSKVLHDAHGTPVGMRGVMVNLTKYIENKMELAQSQNNFKAIFNSSSDMIIIHNQNDQIIEANETVTEIMGYSRDDLFSMNFSSLYSKSEEPLLETIPFHGKKLSVTTFDAFFSTKNGKKIPVEIKRKPLFYDNAQAYICTIRDMSTTSALALERERIKKFEVIELLAAGISHDYNNLLMALSGNLTLLRSVCAENKNSSDEYIDDSIEAINKMKNLTAQLRSFSQDGTIALVSITVHEFIQAMKEEFSSHAYSLTITEEAVLGGNSIIVDEKQMLIALKNCLVNAEQAMNHEGTVSITCESTNIHQQTHPGYVPGTYLLISIHDTGPGIPMDSLDRIFDPFFTTRAERSGLGLATAYAIIKRHSGYIDFEANNPRGTIVKIYLPLK